MAQLTFEAAKHALDISQRRIGLPQTLLVPIEHVGAQTIHTGMAGHAALHELFSPALCGCSQSQVANSEAGAAIRPMMLPRMQARITPLTPSSVSLSTSLSWAMACRATCSTPTARAWLSSMELMSTVCMSAEAATVGVATLLVRRALVVLLALSVCTPTPASPLLGARVMSLPTNCCAVRSMCAGYSCSHSKACGASSCSMRMHSSGH